MDQIRFDSLAKILGSRSTRRVALVALLAGLGGAGNAGAAKHGKGKKSRGQPKFLVCHNGQTLALPARAAKAHLAHGDAQGPCSGPGTGTCVPLHQVCVPKIGNPCCDKNAACVVSDAGARAGIPDYACRDTTAVCTSDAECQARFPDAGPDIVCGENTGGIWCQSGVSGTSKCCRRRACSRTNPCQGGSCCGLGINTKEVCCAADQDCIPFAGCFG